MADENIEDRSPPTSHPFFMHSGFPFVFLPTTFATGFTGANSHTRVSTSESQTNAESGKKENDDNTAQPETEQGEAEKAKHKDDDHDHESDSNSENDGDTHELSDLRISQPKYSQLLKDLDFSKARMVDVTNLLADELDQQTDCLSPDENENPEKILDKNQYESSSSGSSDNESSASISNNKKKTKNKHKSSEERAREQDRAKLMDAANEIQNDLNDLAAILQAAAASQISVDQDENDENQTRNLQKRPTFDEDDDTSKQATQNYDLFDFEQEETAPSARSNKFSRLISQDNTDDILDKSQPSMGNLDVDMNKNVESQSHTEEQEKDQPPIINWDTLVTGTESQNEQPPIINWDTLVTGTESQKQQPPTIDWNSLVNGTESQKQPSNDFISPQLIHEVETTPKRFPAQQPPSTTSKKDIKQQSNSLTQPKVVHRSSQATSSSSSSDTDSVVEYALHRSNKMRTSPPPLEQTIQVVFRTPTTRQDSQETLLDENLDELNGQQTQVFVTHEKREPYIIQIGEETPMDGGADGTSMPLPSGTERLSSSKINCGRLNQEDDNLAHRSSNQHTHQSSRHTHYTVEAPEHANPPRTRAYPYQQYVTSRSSERPVDTNARRPNDDWLSMLERLEREHRMRLEKQQQEYEEYVRVLEEKMKRRFDDYLTLSNGYQETKVDDHEEKIHAYRIPSSVPIDSNIGRSTSQTRSQQYRTQAKDLISQYYPADSTLNVLTSDNKRTIGVNDISRSKSREDNLNNQADIFAKHAKHIADLKLYYEYEINELKNQLNRIKMGSNSSSATARQSMEVIERINNENIRLNDEIHSLRRSLKTAEEDNTAIKKQVEELRGELHKRDNEMKNYHQTVINLEQKLNDAENTTEIQSEKLRHADRQALFYREENEKIKTDLNLTRERLLRLEERYHEQENENEVLRQQLFMLENENNRAKSRISEEHKLNSTMALNEPTSKEYGRFAVPTARHTSPTVITSRSTKIETRRYQPNGIEVSIRHSHSPRPMTRISDYLNEKPVFPTPYMPPPRTSYSPRKVSPDRRRTDPTPTRVHTSPDRQSRQSEQLEQKFDQLLRKKRELESRINRIPLRGQTKTDRQLYEALEREIERVEQQISSVKLELRKLNILRPH